MKRRIAVFLLAFCVLLTMSIPAFAATFSYSFNSTKGTQDSNIGTRTKAAGTDWDLTITSGTLSTSNILGIRPRRYNTTEDSLGKYKTYTSTGTAGRKYTENVQKNWKVFLRSKKDSKSTTSAQLTAKGAFTP